MESLISFDGASEVMNNLINKLSDGIGWIATHDTPMRIAVDTYIQDIQNSNFDPVTKAVLISNARKTIKEHRNKCSITNVACLSMLPTATPEKVDDYWLEQFMDKARLVSDATFQVLWGRILAEECNKPGSIPKALLHIMEQMDSNMAESFMNVAAVSIWYESDGDKVWAPVIIGETVDDYYKDIGIHYGDLVELQSVGLIETELGLTESAFAQKPGKSPIVVHYHDEKFSIVNSNGEFHVGNVVYTNAGMALCEAVSPKKIEGFLSEKCIPFWDKNND